MNSSRISFYFTRLWFRGGLGGYYLLQLTSGNAHPIQTILRQCVSLLSVEESIASWLARRHHLASRKQLRSMYRVSQKWKPGTLSWGSEGKQFPSLSKNIFPFSHTINKREIRRNNNEKGLTMTILGLKLYVLVIIHSHTQWN